jgi:hypothetical protein
MAVCFQYLTLGALSSRSALSVLVGALFKQFGLLLNQVVDVDVGRMGGTKNNIEYILKSI